MTGCLQANLDDFTKKYKLRVMYCGYVSPILEYTDVVWHSSTNFKQPCDIKSIKKACHIILGNSYESCVDALGSCLFSPRRVGGGGGTPTTMHCPPMANHLFVAAWAAISCPYDTRFYDIIGLSTFSSLPLVGFC